MISDMDAICCRCKLTKSTDLFFIKEDKLDSMCIDCRNKKRESNKRSKEKRKDKIKESSKEYYQKNRDKLLNYSKERYSSLDKGEVAIYNKNYRENNKEELSDKAKVRYVNNKSKILENSKKYREENKKYYLDYIKKYRKENKESIRESNRLYDKNKRHSNPVYRNYYLIKCAIHYSLKNIGSTKNIRTEEILGCSIEQFKVYLESKFEPWMNWDNQGNPKDGLFEPNKSWDIDHIIPISSATQEEDVFRLNHYTNLQPLCSYVNRYVKRNK